MVLRVHDPDGDNLKFEWSQTKGSDVKLSDKHDTSPSFVAPEVDKETEMEFELLVDDGNGGTSKDVVKITVQPSITTTDAPGDMTALARTVRTMMAVKKPLARMTNLLLPPKVTTITEQVTLRIARQ